MCDFSEKLIALLDDELAPGEAAEVERHLDACAECSSRLRAYERLSHCVDAYCDAKLEASAPRAVLPGKSVLLGAAAAAAVAVVALLVVVPRLRDVPRPSVIHRVAVPSTVVVEKAAATVTPVQKTHRRPAAAPAQARPVQEAHWLPAEPAIRIAIPAEAVLPPGALPEGVTFVADVRIAPDGSARQMYVWP
jgi:anti-sigma factor RsiW